MHCTQQGGKQPLAPEQYVSSVNSNVPRPPPYFLTIYTRAYTPRLPLVSPIACLHTTAINRRFVLRFGIYPNLWPVSGAVFPPELTRLHTIMPLYLAFPFPTQGTFCIHCPTPTPRTGPTTYPLHRPTLSPPASIHRYHHFHTLHTQHRAFFIRHRAGMKVSHLAPNWPLTMPSSGNATRERYRTPTADYRGGSNAPRGPAQSHARPLF